MSGPDIPYGEGTTAGGVHFFPLHRVAAMKLGMVDPDYELVPGEIWTDLRPSQVESWANVMTRDTTIPYVVCASFVHFLADTHGWEPFMELYARVSSTALAGEDVYGVVLDVYGVEVEQLEDDWLTHLESRPAAHWGAPVSFIGSLEDL